MRLLYDISVLGMAQADFRARTGVFRVVENLVSGLVAVDDCDLYLCTVADNVDACRTFIGSSEGLSGLQAKFVSDLRRHVCQPAKRSSLKQRLQNWWQSGPIRSEYSEHESMYEKQVFHSQYFELPDYLRPLQHIACVQTIHDLIPIKMPFLFSFGNDQQIKRTISKLGPETFVICMSESTRNDLLDYRHDLDSERVNVVYSAASENFYRCADRDLMSSVRGKYGIPDGARYLLSVSTLEPRKNIDHVVRCFLQLLQQERLHDLYLVLTGVQGWKYEAILAEIEGAEEFRDRIILTGFVPDADLAPIYSGALAFVYMSLYEGFGLPPLEAMQCGTPVITSNTSSLPEVVGGAGVLLGTQDADGLCQALLTLYRDETLAKELSGQSLVRAAQFSWSKAVAETMAVYRKAAACG